MAEREVIADWVALELEKGHTEAFDIGHDVSNPDDEAFAQLLAQKPGSARIFFTRDLRWCRATLSERAFRDLRIIWDDNPTVMEVARGIRDGSGSLDADRVEHVRKMAADVDRCPDRWVLTRRRRPGSGPFVHDGNHRAVATAIRLLEGRGYREPTVYVGYPSVDPCGFTGALRRRYHLVTGVV